MRPGESSGIGAMNFPRASTWVFLTLGASCSCEQFDHVKGPVEIGDTPITVTARQPIKALHSNRSLCLRLAQQTGWKIGPGLAREDGQSYQLEIKGWSDAGERTFRDVVVWYEPAARPQGIFACMRETEQTPDERFVRFELSARPPLRVDEIAFSSYEPE